MAVSVTSSVTLRLTLRLYSPPLISYTSTPSLHLPFPLHTSSVSLPPRRHRHRLLPLVEAKKQTESSFDDLILNSEKPVLVDFYATWCGPCQLMVPILEKVGATLKDKIEVVKIDTEEYPALADKYKVEGLPTFIIFKNGKQCDRFEGALAADKLVQRIEKSLAVEA
ncbi:hypothetical protein vseg_009059 [Gypsophila vaccaria]